MAAWSRAAELADRTPASRNRYVDFLRAMSMLVVIVGHWLAAAPHIDARGTLVTAHILTLAPWTAWLTWILQVMPIFFMVGGYANGISWRATRRDGKSYAAWLEGRLRRILWPLLPLLVVWVMIVGVEYARGVRPELISYGSRVAFIPIWFLAVYVVIVLLVPLMEVAWARFGMGSFWALTAAAIVGDVMYFAFDLRWLGFANYLFVWGAISLLGFAWLDERFSDRSVMLFCGALGFAALVLLVHFGPYPVAMIGVPGDPVSNTTPPKVTLIPLAILQGGLLLAVQAPARRWLAGRGAWTATVAINSSIMTLFIWHLTATTLVVLAAYLTNGFGLRLDPGSAQWWWARIPWIIANTLALVPLVAAFGRFERPGVPEGPPALAWRHVLGALVTAAGLALLAAHGVGGYGWFGLNLWGLALAFAGIGLVARRPDSARTS
ncbi:acyltransferase family protein [Hyphomicrobium sp. CS1BSMeth3]|uniref:acyltransferase family protein n=1 Tax=Hyphomicrobium sp. CS1BSMeth3 TaxID=1892844 RepID=UPI000930601A|nr:acyltransferase family protein [Hyphomicrobium sp. CS1BSMeth3]